jgi:hypothetical protein
VKKRLVVVDVGMFKGGKWFLIVRKRRLLLNGISVRDLTPFKERVRRE